MRLNEPEGRLPRWLKYVLLISGLFVVLIAVVVGSLYYSVMNEKTIGYDDAKARAIAETEIAQIEDVERFHGENAYFVISGSDQEGKALFVFVPFSPDEEIHSIEQPAQLTKQVIEDEWREQCIDCELSGITAGLIENTAVWEIKYKENKDTFIYEYIHMEDGTLFEQIQYTQLFN